jgi:diaminopimelate decarboxylase
MEPKQVEHSAATHCYAVIAEVMSLLEQVPQGGVGLSGASLEEIEAAEEAGHNIEQDAVYHVVQKAWLLLNSVSA